MKRIFLVVVVLLLLAPMVVSARGGKGGGGKGAGGAMNVEVREVIVRTTPSYLSPAAGTLTYGTKVNVVGTDGNWCQIDSPSGWVPKNTITKANVKANADQKFSAKGAKQDEVALAGKGFNPQVEAQYKKDNPQLVQAYATVDRVEGFSASDAELKNFRRAGKLN